MSSPGDPGMVNGKTLTQNAIQNDDSCIVNFWWQIKTTANWCAEQSLGIPHKTASLILLTLYFLLKLTYFLVKSAFGQFRK